MSVTEGGLYSATMTQGGVRKLGGLKDPRQGGVETGEDCFTCGNEPSECPGHFGHIELAAPIYHTLFITRVLKVLQSVCFGCSHLKMSPSHPKMKAILLSTDGDSKERLDQVHRLCRTRMTCGDEAPFEPDHVPAQHDETASPDIASVVI